MVGYPFLAAATAFVLVTFNLDPVYVTASILNFQYLSESSVFLVLRHVYYHILIQTVLGHYRCCLLLTIGMNAAFLRVISKLNKTPMKTLSVIRNIIVAFRGLSAMLSLLVHVLNPILGCMLAVMGIIVSTGVCGVVYFANGGNWYFSSGIFLITFLVIVGIFIIFGLASYLLETSGKTLKVLRAVCRGWKGHQGRICYAHVKSLRPLNVKAGSFSVVSAELMKGYLNALLESCINNLLLMNSILGGH